MSGAKPPDIGAEPALEAFASANPGFDIVDADLLYKSGLRELKWEGVDQDRTLPLLRSLQRVMRIEPDFATAHTLLEHGFDSAHSIACLARGHFAEMLASHLEGGVDHARRVHDAAVMVVSRTSHLAANIHSLLDAPHFEAMRVNHIPAEISAHFMELPSYAEIFGSLDYCECDECASILSPAAYLVDLLRVVEQAIVAPNTGRILDGQSFDQRRPDIAQIPLSCANTNDTVPYLQIVAAVLERMVAAELGGDHPDHPLDTRAVYKQLATMSYPYSLPFDLPLTRIRRYLSARKITLAQIYSAFWTGKELEHYEVRELLGLSTEELANLRPPEAAQLASRVAAAYGLTVTDTDLCGLDRLDTFTSQTALSVADVERLLSQDLNAQEVLDTTGSYKAIDNAAVLTILTQDGAEVTGSYRGLAPSQSSSAEGSLRGTLDGLTLRGRWADSDHEAGKRGSFELSFDVEGARLECLWRSDVESVAWKAARTGNSPPRSGGLIPHRLFFNASLGERDYLRLLTDQVEPAHTEIVGQSLQTLDRLNRFLRLARAIGWSWEELDWTLLSLSAERVGGRPLVAELDAGTLTELAKVTQLVRGYGVPLALANALWFDLRTTGRGGGAASLAPFDQIFNSPSALARATTRKPYRPRIAPARTSFPNPLYADEPLPWRIAAADDPSEADLVVASIQSDPAVVRVIAHALFAPATEVSLTLPHLSALHRHAALAAHLGLAGAAYVRLVGLLGYCASGSLPATLSPQRALELIRTHEWIQRAGLRTEEVAYIVSGEPDPSVTAVCDPDRAPAFLAALADAMKPALLDAGALQSPLIPEPAAGAVAQALTNHGLIDPAGVVACDPKTAAVTLEEIKLTDYLPTAGELSEAQRTDVLSRLAAVRIRQEAILASQLAGFAGIPTDAAATLTAVVAKLLQVRVPVASFLGASLFDEPAERLFAGGSLDPKLVGDAFRRHPRPLTEVPLVEACSLRSWSVVDKNPLVTPSVTYRAITIAAADASAIVSLYASQMKPPLPPRHLFDVTQQDVLDGDGRLNASRLEKAFKNHGRSLSKPTITMVVSPRGWTIVDPATGTRYSAVRHGGHIQNVTFFSPSAGEHPMPASISELLGGISRASLLMQRLALSNVAMVALFDAPSAFGATPDTSAEANRTAPGFLLRGVRAVCEYAQLRSRFNDRADALASYLSAPPPREIERLCTVTGWKPADARFLSEAMFKEPACSSLERVSRLARVFSLASRSGVDVYTLHALFRARAMSAETQEQWDSSCGAADLLLQAFAASAPPEHREATMLATEAPIFDRRRDALVAVALWKLEHITTPRALYEHLLLDIEMAGCAQISVIREALNATQLYLRRCRLNLEPGAAIAPENLPAVWWEWLLDYRVWQANREVFLYPENYIDPSLRRRRTKLFEELQNGLMQGPVTDDAVNAAFHKYLDAFAEIARLTPTAACHAVVQDATRGPVDTLFVFSRTSAQPYKFFYASREELAHCKQRTGEVWSEWRPIDITINSPYLTPVYVFGRLHIIWVELREKQEPRDATVGSPMVKTTLANIKLSYRNLAGEWMQPQTILEDAIVDCDAGLYGQLVGLYSDRQAKWWNSVAALRIPAMSARVPGASKARQKGERLYVYYGPQMDASTVGAQNPPTKQSNADLADFNNTIVEGEFVASQMSQFAIHEKVDVRTYGRVAMNPAVVLDSNLEPASLDCDGQYVMVRPNARTETSPPTFRAELRSGALVIAPDRATAFADYVAGAGIAGSDLTPPGSTVNSGWFTSDLVSADLSAAIVKALGRPAIGPPLIDSAGHVVEQALEQTPDTICQACGDSVPITPTIAREVLERLLVAYHGTPLLFRALNTQTASLAPVHNQPGAFLLSNGRETFLVEAESHTAGFPLLDRAIAVTNPFAALTPRSFVGRGISPQASRTIYQKLVESKYVDEPGLVTNHGAEATASALRELLSTDLGRAQQIAAVLRGRVGPAGLRYTGSGFAPSDTIYALQFELTRLSTGVVDLLERALDSGGVGVLLSLQMQQIPVEPTLPFDALEPLTARWPKQKPEHPLVPPTSLYGDQVDLDGPAGVYYWELFFHAPYLIANLLRGDQQFEAAERWLQYVFDPTLAPDPLTERRFGDLLPASIDPAHANSIYQALRKSEFIDDAGNVDERVQGEEHGVVAEIVSAGKGVLDELEARSLRNLLVNRYLAASSGRYWQFQPFRNQTLETLRQELGNCSEIAAYNDEPFDPHAIARLRIGAYEKAIVMAYVGNLIDWGDREFTRYTWESVTTAQMLYSYAGDLLGPRPQQVGPCSAEPPPTFAEILARYGDEIPQFLIDLENELKGGQAHGPILATAGNAFNDIGCVFCVPENAQLIGMWDRVEDRLYKIHHCMNINGQREPLSLWEPPLNPSELVRQAAGSGGLPEPERQLHPIVPNYRFTVMIERAEQLAETVRSFGAELLAALERRDAEGLALLRAGQEAGVLSMVTSTRESAIVDLREQLASLQEGHASADHRTGYYSELISAGLNASEIAYLTLTGASLYARAGTIPLYGLSIPGYLIPTIYGLADGGMQIGDALSAGATITTTISEMLGQSATLAQVVGENQRRAQEWELQQQTATYETAELSKQIAATEARLLGAERDLAMNKQEIANAARVESIMRSNFTSVDLYTWMTGRIAAVYFQAFRLAREMALAAQSAFRFELGREDEFITLGTWDNLHQGLLAGDGLLLSLAQMRKTYLDADSRQLEIEKTISLRQTFPQAFAGFRWGHLGGSEARAGRLDFTLSELLFDFDYPGHYNRKIKSVSVSLPSVIGPYQDFHVTLTQNSDLVVLKPDIGAVAYAIRRTVSAAPDSGAPTPPPPGSLRENWAPSQSIAVSRGIDDPGLFALDFRDERYLPFEGTGAVSSWTLSMPPETNRIDFDNVSDVVLKVRYTARDGGGALASRVRTLLSGEDESLRCVNAVVFNLASAFSSQWRTLIEGRNDEHKITFTIDTGAVLPNLGEVELHGIIVQLELKGDPPTSLSVQAEGAIAEITLHNNFGELTPERVKDPKWDPFQGKSWSLQFDDKFAASGLKDIVIAFVYSARPFA